MFFGKRKSKETFITDEKLDSVAIIMDGNGRWAKARFLPRSAGHAAGAKNLKPVLNVFRDIGIHYVTLYAFSTENWKRPREEVDALMGLALQYIGIAEKQAKENSELAFRFLGDRTVLTPELAAGMSSLEKMTTGRPFVCSVAFNYGGHDEIVHAANEAFRECGGAITEKDIENHLYTAGTPAPDLLIRTGGDVRMSNFLLWQCAYTEFYFTKTLWPDFGREDILDAVRSFYKRKRRYGGLDTPDTTAAGRKEKK